MDSLIAGAFAGLVVDLSLYPIDTIKTRIQSKEGFWASGGLRNIYKGLSAVAIGSIPGGAAFFFFYDTTKSTLFRSFDLQPQTTEQGGSAAVVMAQSVAASVGECAACCVRVPTEMVKQQLQAGRHHSPITAIRCITNNVNTDKLANPGAAPTHINFSGISHLFRGMPIMLLREIPFSVIQMSLYEGLKRWIARNDATASHFYALLPLCGGVAGGTAAFLTTPLDVVKTRIMLQHETVSSRGIRHVVQDILLEPARSNDRFGAAQKFFRGAPARVFWISAGGSVFFSAYEYCRLCTNRVLQS